MSTILVGLSLTLLSFQAPAERVPDSERLARVVVIGASMSAGFGASRSFGDALEASIRAPHKKVSNFASELFFTNPLTFGKQQVGSALDSEATLVVGLDFLFWFGYGTLDARGGPLDSEAERLELLERGLAYLAEFECPLLVGDFPDMSAAVGKMLSAAQMPARSTLPLLSKRVREWAAGRAHTTVVPLSELVLQLGAKSELHIGRHFFPAGTQLLQQDELHPTLQGLAASAQLVCDELIRLDLAKEADFDFELAGVFKKLGAELLPAPAKNGVR
ncbi:MAG: hypothetical protein EXS08_08470 [Planctomycetes bacterium]|nr:hypothetical protein [Planctomycetota bacterium]